MIYNKKTNLNNVIYFKDYRISLYNEYSFRIEKDANKKFNDEKTQLIINRYFKDLNFKILENSENNFRISFYDYILFYNELNEKFYLKYKDIDRELKNSDDSLGGTYVTVDMMDGDKYLGKGKNEYVNGLITKSGIYLLHDEKSNLLDDNDDILEKKNNDQLDLYVFLSFKNKSEVVNTFYKLSGYPPLLDSYVFGNWWSRYYPYSQDEYLYLMKKFLKEEVPFTVSIIDMDWHYSWTNGRNIYQDSNIPEEEFFFTNSEGKKEYVIEPYNKEDESWRYGWTGYTFNKALFKNPKKFMDDLHSLNLKVGLNIHPADGIAFFENCYKEMALKNNIDPTSKKSVPFDFTNKIFRDSYFEYTLKPLKDYGTDFFWIDWQQGEESKFADVTPLWLCNHYFYKNEEKYNENPIILSRFASKGGQRYPLGFSGDAFQTFSSLKYLIKMTIGSSDCGFTYRSHDIGGHMEGEKSGDLYLKFIQFGVFSPINRLHCTCSDILNKDPDLYINGYSDLIKNYLRLRHKMIPYLYSYNYLTHEEGYPLIRPLYYDDNSKNAYKFKDSEYVFASNLLISPFDKKEDENGISKKEVYFSLNDYYDLKYGYKYKKNKKIKIYRERGDMPLFIKEGGYFILSTKLNQLNYQNINEYDCITTSGNSLFVFNELSKEKKVVKTIFKNELVNNTFKITIECEDNNKIYNFKILNIFKINSIEATNCDLKEIHTEGDFLEFKILKVDKKAKIIIDIIPFNNSLEEVKFYLSKRLNYIDDINNARILLYEEINKANSVALLISSILNSKIKKHNKKLLLEIIEGL